jgi:hypothetical protein
MSEIYKQKVTNIKRKLRKYDDISFLNMFMKHMEHSENHELGILRKRPWCCFLSLKWKLTSNTNNNQVMLYNDFRAIIQEIYDLQIEATDFSTTLPIELELRRFLIPQLLYQTPFITELNSLIRQYIWFCDSNEQYFSTTFTKITGVTLLEYYSISLHMIILSDKQVDKEAFRLSYSDIIVTLHPKFSIDTLAKYFSFVSNTLSSLSSFLKPFTQKGNPEWEYFEDTPLLLKPIIMNKNDAYILCKPVLITSLVNLVPKALKLEKKSEYKVIFGKIMESYIGGIINQQNYSFYNEEELKEIYSLHNIKGKVVDYVIKEKEATIFIDSKAIEPEIIVKTSSSPEQLKARLDGSFIKGVIQGQTCAERLEKCKNYTPSTNDVILIITHHDHFISSGSKLNKLIAPELEKDIVAKLQKVRVPFDRTYYLTVDDFELLIEVSTRKKIAIHEIISIFQKDDLQNNSSKFSFTQHLRSMTVNDHFESQSISNTRMSLLKDIYTPVIKPSIFWDNKIQYLFQCLVDFKTAINNHQKIAS